MNRRPYELYLSLDDLAPLWQSRSGWAREAHLRAALVSLELGFLMVADAQRDERRAARKEERIDRLWTSAASQVRLLGALFADALPPREIAVGPPSTATNLGALREVHGPRRSLRAFVDGYDATLEVLPFQLGLEAEIERVRAAHRWPRSPPRRTLATLPYDAFAAPHAVAAIFERRTFNAEDRLFAATHQSVECWMFVVLGALSAGGEALEAHDLAAATRSIEEASAIVAHLADALTILETMVLCDYHPLRVRLRDASGAQSRQIAAALEASRKLERRARETLAARGLSYVTVIRCPEALFAEYALVEALTTLECRASLFLFNHFKLAGRILGTKSLGSLGVELKSLVDRFVEPLFPELDRARHRYSVSTSFAHGRHAGSIVSELEGPNVEPMPRAPCEPVDEVRMREAIRAYFDAMRGMDLERWVSLFSANGAIESPAGSRPFRGKRGLCVFFRNFMKVFEPGAKTTMRAIRIDATRGHAEVDWKLDVRHEGLPISYTGTEIFDFAPSGEIVRVTVHDDPLDIAQQMLPSTELAAFLPG